MSTKISGYTADAAPTSDDLIVTVNDPGGTPVNRKVTLANLATALAGMSGFTGTFAPVADAATVLTSQTTASTTYADLSTSGPAVTITVPASGEVWVDLSTWMASSGSNAATYMGVAVSGATTRAADDDHAVHQTAAANFDNGLGVGVLLTGLTPGSNTFTAKYRTSGGTATFKNRNIRVSPLP